MSKKTITRKTFTLCSIAISAALCTVASAETAAPEIKRYDGKPADMAKPVQVFILLGQSNMVGLGKITGGEGSLEQAVKEKKKYPYLVDDAGAWVERKDVRYVQVMQGRGAGGMQLLKNEWMTVSGGKMGPEFGIGHPLGNAVDAPVMTPTLKSRPASCSTLAFSAMAVGMTLAAPAGVNPLKPMVSL